MTKMGYKGRIIESEGFVNCPYIPKAFQEEDMTGRYYGKGHTKDFYPLAKKTELDMLEAMSLEICKAINEEVIKEMTGEKRSEMPNWLTPGVTVREVDITEYIPAASNTHGLILKKTEEFSNIEFTYSNPPLDIEAELRAMLKAECEKLFSEAESLPEINESKSDDFKMPHWLQPKVVGIVQSRSLIIQPFDDPDLIGH